MPNMAEEFNRHYPRCIVKTRDGNLLSISEVRCDRDSTRDDAKFLGVYVPINRVSERKTASFYGRDLDFNFPDLGCINIPSPRGSNAISGVYDLRRVPARQWRRAYNKGVVNQQFVISCADRMVRIPAPDLWGWNSLPHHHYPFYSWSYSESINQVNSGRWISHAFTPTYWVGVSPDWEGMVVGYKRNVIGKVLTNRRMALFEEFIPHIQALGEYVDIEVRE